MNNKRNVLMIDDEKSFCKLSKMNLEMTGKYSVLTATNGADGIKIAKKARPDIILLDIIMPTMDGLEVLKILKEDKKTMDIPVVMLSAKGEDETKIKASELYSTYYITKPVSAEDLMAKIEWVLEISGRQK